MQSSRGKEAWRVLRIQSELVEGIQHLSGVGPSVTVFGSARLGEDSAYYQAAQELSRRLSAGGINVLTGGGPGIMESANKGAFHEHACSIGLNIELPHEQGANPYQDLGLNFRYFFIRKLMFVKHAVGFVVFPGGYGTMDELFEALTLVQTGKISSFPVVLYGSEYWSGLVDWLREQMVREGCIDAEELELLQLVDSVDDAYRILERSWQAWPQEQKDNLPESL